MFYLLYKIGVFLALGLPIKISYRIADVLGSFYYWLARKDKKIAASNIRVVLAYTHSQGNINYTTRMVFVNFARYLVEFFRTPMVDLEYIKKHINIEARENLDAALRLGRGALLVSAHLGNWELGAIVLSMLGYKVNIVAWTHKDKLINDFFLAQRQSKGLKVIPLGTSIRKVFSALRANEIVAVLADIDYANPRIGIKVNFFGRDTTMPKGPALFNLKVNCPIVPTFLFREKDNKFRLIFEQPIIYQATGNKEKDLIYLTGKVAKKIEYCIAQSPSQWFMLVPRW